MLLAADRVTPAELALWEHSMGFARTQLLGALAEHGVIEALADGPATARRLADRLGLDADALHRVLRATAVFGLVRIDRRGRFRLTALGQALRKDRDVSLSAWARYTNLRSTREAWAGLSQTLETGEPSFPLVHGRSVWDHFADNPHEEELFARAMRDATRFDVPAAVAAYRWPQEGTVCDVAGGVGTLLGAVLADRPGLRGVLVEAPGVLREAERYLEERGLCERVTLVAGDMFERVDAAGDLYLLKDILHDWDDDRCRRILRTVRRAMPAGSRLVVVEGVLGRNEVDPIRAMVDVHMLTQADGGRQRSVGELQALMGEAGLSAGAVHRTAGPALVEGIAR
jgi:O-methyltransferase domain